MVLVLTVVGVLYGWSEWWGKEQRPREKPRHRIAISVGLIGVTLQLFLFMALRAPLTASLVVLERCMIAEFPFLVVVRAVVIWKNKAKWRMFGSPVALPIPSFLLCRRRLPINRRVFADLKTSDYMFGDRSESLVSSGMVVGDSKWRW